uniref:G-protein coupled receptors family 1 profile domain-containing protein n=1 Tax=Parascaris univalens TaxID=6257 RepID=A0A915CEZ8_PARUN
MTVIEIAECATASMIIIANVEVPEKDLAGRSHVLRIPKTVDCVQNVLTVIPLQLLSYHITDLNGLNVSLSNISVLALPFIVIGLMANAMSVRIFSHRQVRIQPVNWYLMLLAISDSVILIGAFFVLTLPRLGEVYIADVCYMPLIKAELPVLLPTELRMNVLYRKIFYEPAYKVAVKQCRIDNVRSYLTFEFLFKAADDTGYWAFIYDKISDPAVSRCFWHYEQSDCVFDESDRDVSHREDYVEEMGQYWTNRDWSDCIFSRKVIVTKTSFCTPFKNAMKSISHEFRSHIIVADQLVSKFIIPNNDF